MAHKHNISLQEAVEMTSRYRKEKDSILKPEYAGKDVLPIAETFDKSAFEELVREKGCVSIRAYLGMDENKNIRLIFVGVNDKDEDILPDQGGAIMEYGSRCPPQCGKKSPLNS